MTTLSGKSAVRTVSIDKVPKRSDSGEGTGRDLEVIHDGNNVYLHMHSPGNLDNGWAIKVSKQELIRALTEK